MANRAEKPEIFVYDLEEEVLKKTVGHGEVGTRDIACLAFSDNRKYLAALGSEPTYLVVLYFWEKGKMMAQAKSSSPSVTAPVYQVRKL